MSDLLHEAEVGAALSEPEQHHQDVTACVTSSGRLGWRLAGCLVVWVAASVCVQP